MRGRLASPSPAGPCSEATQAWPRQEAGQQPQPLLSATWDPPHGVDFGRDCLSTKSVQKFQRNSSKHGACLKWS